MPAAVLRKKPTNVSIRIRADLLAKAKTRRINLLATLEDAFRESAQAAWLEQNREAIAAYGRHVERDSLFADSVRIF